MAKRLAGRSAFITGAASGLGREAALQFAREGAAVIGLDRDDTLLQESVAAVESEGGRMLGSVGDAADEEDVRRAIEAGMAAFGRLDIIFPCAGVLWRDVDLSVVDTEVTTWDTVMAINLRGPMLACKHGIPRMKSSGGGSVVLVGSISALAGFTAAQDAYTSSKGALISLTRSLAVQFASDGIRANIIHPGIIATPMQAIAMQDPAWIQGVESQIPMGRMATAADIAKVAVFLASDDAGYMTGSEVVVDGGFTAR